MYRLQSLKDDFRDTETRLGWQMDVVKLDLKADNVEGPGIPHGGNCANKPWGCPVLNRSHASTACGAAQLARRGLYGPELS